MRVAADLLARGGREAVSTRLVSAAAGVQAPTIYRQFGDMRGLLDAVARETFTAYVRQQKSDQITDDPIEDLKRGWDMHVAFGLAHPVVYALIYGDPTASASTSAARDAHAHLHHLLTRAAEAGWLKVSVARAAQLLVAAGSGVTLSLIATPPAARDLQLSETLRAVLFAAITISPTPNGASEEKAPRKRVAARAVALHAVLSDATDGLTLAERQLLSEWLNRLADTNG